MARVLDIPAEQLSAVAALRDLGTDGLERLNQTLRSHDVLLHLDELQRKLEPILGAKADSVGEVLLGLSLLQRKGPRPEGVMDDLTETLRMRSDELEPPWGEVEFARWANLREPLVALLATESVLTVGKALDLHFAHANILRDVQIVTDVRPVFDSTGEKPLAAVIAHTLCMRYLDDGRPERLSLALDHDDLDQIMKACERAVKKGTSLKAKLEGLLRTEIAGIDDTDGGDD
jgi:hypothetical protein